MIYISKIVVFRILKKTQLRTIRSDQISQTLSPMLVFLRHFLKSENCHKIRFQPSDLAHIKTPVSWNRKKSIFIGLRVDITAKIYEKSKNRRRKFFKKIR